MKNTLIRIFASILAATTFATSLLCTQSVSAKAIPLITPESQVTEPEEGGSDAEYFDPELNGTVLPEAEDESVRYDQSIKDGSMAGYTPGYYDYISQYNYENFAEIAELYQQTHLYSFTTEQLYDAFLRKLLADNPYLFKMFLSTLLSTMDEYSGYYESDSGFLSSSGKYYGITMSAVAPEERKLRGWSDKEGLFITAIMEGSSAQSVGVMPGDRISAVGDFDVEGLPADVVNSLVRCYPFTPEIQDPNAISITQIERILKGETNDPELITKAINYFTELLEKANNPEITPPAAEQTPVGLTLTVDRNGTFHTFTMEKSNVNVSQVSVNYDFDQKIATIVIQSFAAKGVAEDVKEALAEIKSFGIRKIIIDLRNNGGGYIDEAVAIADLFVTKEGEVYCYLNSRLMDKPQAIKSAGTGKDYGDIVILTNEYSASASELFALVMRNYADAFIIGTTTYGKALGQTAYGLMNGDMITVTDSEILTPGMKSYNRIGIFPDLEVDILEMRYAFPEELKQLTLTYDGYLAIKPGEYSENALAFEKYFAFAGYLDSSLADGIIDDNTTKAINAYLIIDKRVPDGVLTEADINLISNSVNKYRAYFYKMDAQYEVATFYFRSLSQAKRRIKELEKESAKAVEQRKEMERLYIEELKKLEEQDKQEAQKEQNGTVTGDNATTEILPEANTAPEAVNP